MLSLWLILLPPRGEYVVLQTLFTLLMVILFKALENITIMLIIMFLTCLNNPEAIL